jgi:hypothetical protein
MCKFNFSMSCVLQNIDFLTQLFLSFSILHANQSLTHTRDFNNGCLTLEVGDNFYGH